MKILYFTGKFIIINNENVRYGGTEYVVYNLAYNMVKSNHNVIIISISDYKKDIIEKYEDIIIYKYKKIFNIINRDISFNIIIKPLINNLNVDIIHVHTGYSPNELISSLFFYKHKKIPLIVTYHGDILPLYNNLCYRISIKLFNILLDKILKYADVITCPSKTFIKTSNLLSKYKDKVIVIPNGININKFNIIVNKYKYREKYDIPHDKIIILFLGALHPKKGPDILLKALNHIIKNNNYSRMIYAVIAGEGPMKNHLQKLAKKLNIDNFVKFVGFIKEHEKIIYFKLADIFCLPSITTTESFGIVNLEAMASGLPIIASNVGGVSDVVRDGVNGILVPPKDPKRLADALLKLIEDDKLRKKMGKASINIAKKYSWENISKKFEYLYKYILYNK